MAHAQSRRQRRCAHPACRDVIEPGETYELVDGERYHLECWLVVVVSA